MGSSAHGLGAPRLGYRLADGAGPYGLPRPPTDSTDWRIHLQCHTGVLKALLSRTHSTGFSLMDSTSRPSRTPLRSCTAVRPISSMGERTEESGMGSSAAREVSLKPTTATSRPTPRPWDRRAPMAPMAAKSLTANSAVGWE